jgi:hypothetical protein
VVGELFFDPEDRTLTDIQRHDFREIEERVGSFKSVYFPKKVTIVSPETGKNTAIFYGKVTHLDSIDAYQFLLRIQKGTKEVFLDEVDPRFSLMGAAEPSAAAKAEKIAGKNKAPAPEQAQATLINPTETEDATPSETTVATNLPQENDQDADIALQ